MFIKHNFKIFWCNPNDPNFDLFKFLGKINLCVLELHERNSVSRVISKITSKEILKKNSCSDEIKRIKTISQKHFTKLKKMTKIKNLANKY